jgi:Fur family peroxide stress response transcriptional regulator
MDDLRGRLKEKGFKITPQRLAVLEILLDQQVHPTADQVIRILKDKQPDIATGTVYKILEAFAQRGLIRKVKTDRDVMRYDAIQEHHHHLYCSSSDRIEDYRDEDLNALLDGYFKTKEITGFKVEEVRLQIVGRFEGTENH